MATHEVNFKINIIGDKVKVAVNQINASVQALGVNISKVVRALQRY